jgi:hypothetical protein
MTPPRPAIAHRTRLTAALVATLAILAGCAPALRVRGDFAPDGRPGTTFSHLLVLGVSPDLNQRCAFEQALAASLRSGTVRATMSCEAIDAGRPLTREAVEQAIAKVGADGVLATTLVQSTAKVKEGGSADARGGGYYKATGVGYDYGYWGAYGVPVVYAEFETAPSVFSISGTVELSTRLFETRNGVLVYSVVTEAKDLPSREMALAEITPAIAGQLQRAALIR